MRNLTRFSIVLTACTALGAAACGDDGGDTKTDTTATTTTPDATTSNPDSTTTEDTTSTPDSDAVVTDPCATNPCINPPGPVCDQNSIVTSTGPGTCTAGTGTNYTCTYTETPTACTGTDVCSAGACVAAGDKCDYTFGSKVSYVSYLSLGNQKKVEGSSPAQYEDDCCFDFNDDGKIDNKLGSLLGGLQGVIDVNGSITEQIEGGDLALLLETKGVDDLTNDTSLDIAGFYGTPVGTFDYAAATAGNGTFVVNPASFVPNTMLPLIAFPGASITDGKLAAGPNIFNLSIPIAGAQLNIAVSNTKLTGTVSAGGNGEGLKIDGGADVHGARLGGVVKKIDLINALNSFVSTCTCVEITGGDEMIAVSGNTASCRQASTTNCTAPSDSSCKQIPGYCGTLLALLTPDIDTDGDDCPSPGVNCTAGINDGISVGVFLKANSATVTGVDTCAAPE